MNTVWWYILAAIIVGSILKYLVVNPWAWVAIDVALFAAVYLILRRYPWINLKRSVTFFGCLTIVNIFVDLGIVDGFIGQIAIRVLLGWMIFGGGRQGGGGGRPPRPRHPWHK
jgi:hypothetical protein